jgi:hypothetical protein
MTNQGFSPINARDPVNIKRCPECGFLTIVGNEPCGYCNPAPAKRRRPTVKKEESHKDETTETESTFDAPEPAATAAPEAPGQLQLF